jgi:hypothetical protein
MALLFGVSQAWAQNETTPGSSAQPNESSVLLPPPTPPQAGQAAQGQAQANAQMPGNTQQPANSAQSSGQYLQPSGQVPQQANQQQANQGQMTTPEPPRIDDQSSQSSARPIARAQLGVFVVPTDGAGVRINSVTSGTAADTAGLKPGDIVLAMNGQSVTNPHDVIEGIRAMNVGDAVELRIWRNGQEQNITATLQEMRGEPIVEYGGPVNEYSTFSYDPVVRRYYPGTVRRYYNNYPGGYYSYPRYGYGNYYGNPYGGYYGAGAYYGTPGFGYYNGPWGQGVRIGSFGFGWR